MDREGEKIVDWAPTASASALRTRAKLLGAVRRFFEKRGVLEVETPLLGAAAASDPHLDNIAVDLATGTAAGERRLYLQTSPEHAMKRLLAAGSGPIFQLCKAFRGQECGRLHNPEFTLLEWYRPGVGATELMDEVDELLAEVAGTAPSRRIMYRAAFDHHLKLDPFAASIAELRMKSAESGMHANTAAMSNRDTCLDYLLTHRIQPSLDSGLVAISDFPASQAMQARLSAEQPGMAERFEFFLDGIEIANGNAELTDPEELEQRMLADEAERRELELPPVKPDPRLLAAMHSGLPTCAGVAVGVDRLLMCLLEVESIQEAVAFPIDRA